MCICIYIFINIHILYTYINTYTHIYKHTYTRTHTYISEQQTKSLTCEGQFGQTWLVVSVMTISIFCRAVWRRLLVLIRSWWSCGADPKTRLSVICRETSRPSSSSAPDQTSSAPPSLLWTLPADTEERRLQGSVGQFTPSWFNINTRTHLTRFRG